MNGSVWLLISKEGFERGKGYLAYRAHIGIGLAPDNDLRIHVLPFPAGFRYYPLYYPLLRGVTLSFSIWLQAHGLCTQRSSLSAHRVCGAAFPG
jgi:hypothetical protein